MSLVSLDDGFFDCPKAVRAGEDGANLHVRAIAWCRRYNTGGVIPKGALGRLSSKRDAAKHASACVTAELWHDDGESWRIHDYEVWYANDAEVKLEKQRKLAASRQRNLRDRRSGLEGVRAEVFARDGYKCVYCGFVGTNESLTLDHVVPKSRGGGDEVTNLATSCRPCNSLKHTKTPGEWRDSKTKRRHVTSRDVVTPSNASEDVSTRDSRARASAGASPYSDSDTDSYGGGENTPAPLPDESAERTQARIDAADRKVSSLTDASIAGDVAADILARSSRGRVDLLASSTDLRELARVCRTARPPLDADWLEVIGDAIAAGGALAWCKDDRIRINFLVRDDGKHLLAAAVEAKSWAGIGAPNG